MTTALIFFSIEDVSYIPQLEVSVELGLVIFRRSDDESVGVH